MVHAHCCRTCFKEGLETFFFLGIEMNAHIIVGHAKDRQFFITSFDKKNKMERITNCQAQQQKRISFVSMHLFYPKNQDLTRHY